MPQALGLWEQLFGPWVLQNRHAGNIHGGPRSLDRTPPVLLASGPKIGDWDKASLRCSLSAGEPSVLKTFVSKQVLEGQQILTPRPQKPPSLSTPRCHWGIFSLLLPKCFQLHLWSYLKASSPNMVVAAPFIIWVFLAAAVSRVWAFPWCFCSSLFCCLKNSYAAPEAVMTKPHDYSHRGYLLSTYYLHLPSLIFPGWGFYLLLVLGQQGSSQSLAVYKGSREDPL